MKDKKKLLIIIGGIVALFLIGLFSYNFFTDKNKLTKTEKEWIADNLTTVQNISVINNTNVFGDNGTGVFYDFIKDFQTEYRLEINPITFLQGDEVEGIYFSSGNKIDKKSTVFYIDHYAIVGNGDSIYWSATDFKNYHIGALSTDVEYLKKYLPYENITSYDTVDALYEALKSGGVNYVISPILRDIDKILSNNYEVIYHFGDIKYYYYFEGAKDNILSSIIKKYFNNWNKKYFNEIFNSNELITFTEALNLTDADISELKSVKYNYGFLNHNPYEIITGGNFGGIVAVYLKNFSDFANVDFNFKKYSNSKKFQKALDNGDIDLYYDYYIYDNKLENLSSHEGINVDIIVPSKNNLTINILNTLDEMVYVQKNSKIARYFKMNTGLKIGYYDNQKDMLKLAKKGKIIAIDNAMYEYYHKNSLKNYESRFNLNIEDTYSFKVKENKVFKTLINAYFKTLDPKEIKYEGLYNHSKTVQKGSILVKIAKYIIVILLILASSLLFAHKKGKRIKVAKRIKNEDKAKYIDLLTSLKNRNYLSENMEAWNNNKIYPQTMIVIDLNNIAYLNDKKGYEAGDQQITALANILIKTQLDNSDIMRTNGNEFLIYLVGYQQKHVVNYIHKLNKELKKLPYEYGAAIGYSMITDDIKTIEDAINEALEDMKKQKAKTKEVKN